MFRVLQLPPCVRTVLVLLVTEEHPLTTLQVMQGLPFFLSPGLVHGSVEMELDPRASFLRRNKESFKLGALRVTTWNLGTLVGDVLFQVRELETISLTSFAFSLVSTYPAPKVMIHGVNVDGV